MGVGRASPVAGSAVVRFSALSVAIAGCALVAVGLFAVSRWDAAPALVLLAPVLFVQGFGAGLFQVANLDMVTAGMPAEDRGVAGSLAMLTRTVGVVSGAALLSLLFGTLESASLAGGAPAAESFLEIGRAHV